MELRVIDLDDKYFECQKRKFYKKESLSFNRYRELQKLILEFGYNATFVDIFKNIRKAWDHMNALKLGEAAVELHNIMTGIKSLEEKHDPALRICALFYDEEGEDPTVFDDSKMREKIDCWGMELDVSPFFQLASRLVPFWINAYKIVTRDGSVKVEGKKEHSQSPIE
jgi:hypothetical protein